MYILADIPQNRRVTSNKVINKSSKCGESERIKNLLIMHVMRCNYCEKFKYIFVFIKTYIDKIIFKYKYTIYVTCREISEDFQVYSLYVCLFCTVHFKNA